MSSKTLRAQNDDHIKSVLKLIGFSKINKIASTLQGSVWEVVETTQTKQELPYTTKYTKVIKVTNKYMHKHSIAIQYNKTYKIMEDILKEKSILEYLTKQSNTPKSIVKYYDFFQSNSHFYLIMQHAGRSLWKFLTKAWKLISNGNISIKEWHRVVKLIVKQLIEAVEYIHSCNICHYDLSLSNCLINDIQIKQPENTDTNKGQIEFILDNLQITLCDFGLADYFNEPNSNFLSNKWCGKINYKSPEINNKEYFNAKSNDIWCLGIMIWMITLGISPFKIAHKSDPLFLCMMNGQMKCLLKTWNKYEYVDDEWIDLMECFFKYEKKRISIEQIKKHSWFK